MFSILGSALSFDAAAAAAASGLLLLVLLLEELDALDELVLEELPAALVALPVPAESCRSFGIEGEEEGCRYCVSRVTERGGKASNSPLGGGPAAPVLLLGGGVLLSRNSAEEESRTLVLLISRVVKNPGMSVIAANFSWCVDHQIPS